MGCLDMALRSKNMLPGICVRTSLHHVRTWPAEEENRILEMLSSLDQQLRLISVCGPIELKLCKNVHET
jgi:hypothetical protein